MRESIGVVLDEAKPYNAAEHGLAVGAGEGGLSLGNPGETPVLDRKGPALNDLELVGAPEDRLWQTTTQWVDPERAMALVTVVKGTGLPSRRCPSTSMEVLARPTGRRRT